ncbi:MAG: tripartite tricarboxylate transporter TctB family protein [Candidatus Accumulibacter sp.]|nr:tripartite tricarboxylate transporter TctB family protein [Accumulibacter sp.]
MIENEKAAEKADEKAAGEKTLSAWVKRQNAGLWFGLCFLAFSVLFFRLSFDLPYQSRLGAGPGMYPRWLSGIAIGVALLYIWQSCTVQVFRVGDSFPGRRALYNVAEIFFSCLVFLMLLNSVGFIVAGSLLLFITFARHYRVWLAVALSIGITLVCYLVFKVCFSVPLP